MDRIVEKVLHIKVRGLDDELFDIFHKQLASHRDKFSRPHDVLLEIVRLSSADLLSVEIYQVDDVGVNVLIRLIQSLPIVREIEGILGIKSDVSYKGFTPEDELTVLLEQETRENHLSDIVPLVPVSNEMGRKFERVELAA